MVAHYLIPPSPALLPISSSYAAVLYLLVGLLWHLDIPFVPLYLHGAIPCPHPPPYPFQRLFLLLFPGVLQLYTYAPFPAPPQPLLPDAPFPPPPLLCVDYSPILPSPLPHATTPTPSITLIPPYPPSATLLWT